jgi:glycosyltransferase involved in cell wall biosynthesis
MRLGFHYHTSMIETPDSALKTPGYLGRFLDALAARCDQVVCFAHAPRASDRALMDYTLQNANIRWVNIGPHSSVIKRQLRAQAYSRAVIPYRDQLDALLIRGPSPLLPAIAKAAHPVPVSLLLVGDYLAGVDELPQPSWRRELIRLWAHWNYRQQMQVGRDALVFVNSRKLFDQVVQTLPHVVETRTTTLSTDDFVQRDDVCQSRPIRLLYTGRMVRDKGVFELVDAVRLLVDSGQDVVLDLVGWPQSCSLIIGGATSTCWPPNPTLKGFPAPFGKRWRTASPSSPHGWGRYRNFSTMDRRPCWSNPAAPNR